MNPKAIRALRARNGWTQGDLAARLGTDPVTVSRWERGVTKPRPSGQTRLKELSGELPSEVASLVRLIGASEAVNILKRQLLLTHQLPRRRFATNPTRRLREVDKARREQLELKARIQAGPATTKPSPP